MAESVVANAGIESRRCRTRLIGVDDCDAVLEFLEEAEHENLILIDAALNLARTYRPYEVPPTIYGVFEEGRLCGVASMRPSIVFSAGVSEAALESLLPLLRRVPNGLLKCDSDSVDRVWPVFRERGRQTLIDRIEIAYRLCSDAIVPAPADLPGVARPARAEDLEDLIHAARASLWEEDRPDPAVGDPEGFRRWVASRLPRARVVTEGGEIVFVAYADVRREAGWLVQGVYTWPEVRRRGYARRGMDSLVREAFASGASHVQLAVVEGNARATRLYQDLGFVPFQRLRTILFH